MDSLRDAASWIAEGDAHLDAGEHERALVCYDRALELDPQCVEAHYDRGRALSRLDREEEALEAFARRRASDIRGVALHLPGPYVGATRPV